jgi:hypothetical protein
MGLLVVALALAVFVAAPAPAPDQAEDELRKLEAVWNMAHLEGDADSLGRLWADDLEVAVPRMAVLTRAEALSFSRSGRMTFRRYESSDVRVRVYSDAAVVTGRILRVRVREGREVQDDWLFTKTYVKRDGRWQIVAFHASDAPAP